MMMDDFNLAKMVMKKGIEFKVKNGELTEEQAQEILRKLDGDE